MIPFDTIIDELEKQTNVSKEELKKRVENKQKELSGLVTLEGAGHLVAREMGIDLFEKFNKKLEIGNIVSGMRNVDVIGRVFKISGITEFARSDGSKGRVVNIFVGDRTGYVRLPLWDKQVSLIENDEIKLGDIVQISAGLAKENIYGDIEVSLGKFGIIRAIESDVSFPSADDLLKKLFLPSNERVEIKNLVTGNFEIRGTVVNVFRTNFIFDVCSTCGSRVDENKKCSEHGDVETAPALVISCILDDGTGDIRIVLFRSLAEQVIQADASKLNSLDPEARYDFIKEKLLGRELALAGKVKKNERFGNLEFLVSSLKDLNVLEESKKLAEEIESKLPL